MLSNIVWSRRDDLGPLAELHYWRHLLAKFTSVVEHNNSQKCKHFIEFLTQSKSKLIEVKHKKIYSFCTITKDQLQKDFSLTVKMITGEINVENQLSASTVAFISCSVSIILALWLKKAIIRLKALIFCLFSPISSLHL